MIAIRNELIQYHRQGYRTGGLLWSAGEPCNKSKVGSVCLFPLAGGEGRGHNHMYVMEAWCRSSVWMVG